MIKNVSLALIILISGFSYAQDNNQSIDELLAKVAQNAPQMQTIELKYNIALAEAEIQKGNELLQYTFSAPSLLNTSIPNVFNDSSVELPLSLAYNTSSHAPPLMAEISWREYLMRFLR